MAAVNLKSGALNVLITAANRGIGLSLAKQFYNAGYNVIGTSRSTAPDQIADLSAVAVAVVPLDVASEESIKSLPQRLPVKHLDVVVNNAGLLHRDTFDSVTVESMLDQFKVNTLGPLLVTRALLPLLRASPNAQDRKRAAKVVQITSRMGSIEDNGSGGYYGYRASKCALNMITKSLANDLNDVSCFLLHPGYIQTRMTNQQGDMNPDECAARLFKVISNCSAEDSGKFFHRDGQTLPW